MGLTIITITAFERQPTPYLALILTQILLQCNTVAALPSSTTPDTPVTAAKEEEEEKKDKGGISLVFKVVLSVVLSLVFIVFVYSTCRYRQRKRERQRAAYEAGELDWTPTDRHSGPKDTISRLRQFRLQSSKSKGSPGFSAAPILSQPSPTSPGPISPLPQAHNLRSSKTGSRGSHRSKSTCPHGTDLPPVYVSPRKSSFEDIQVLPISNISSPVQSPTFVNGAKNSTGGKVPHSPPAYSDANSGFSRASSRGASMPPTYDNLSTGSVTDISNSTTPAPSVSANPTQQS